NGNAGEHFRFDAVRIQPKQMQVLGTGSNTDIMEKLEQQYMATPKPESELEDVKCEDGETTAQDTRKYPVRFPKTYKIEYTKPGTRPHTGIMTVKGRVKERGSGPNVYKPNVYKIDIQWDRSRFTDKSKKLQVSSPRLHTDKPVAFKNRGEMWSLRDANEFKYKLRCTPGKSCPTEIEDIYFNFMHVFDCMKSGRWMIFFYPYVGLGVKFDGVLNSLTNRLLCNHYKDKQRDGTSTGGVTADDKSFVVTDMRKQGTKKTTRFTFTPQTVGTAKSDTDIHPENRKILKSLYPISGNFREVGGGTELWGGFEAFEMFESKTSSR
ncbi:MAG: hypothetical protein VXX23_02040, partial [Actinomycetota bacterium]|nr:hypothetical protein [Actinomycetota bacterium]